MGEKPLGWPAGNRTERPHAGDDAWNPDNARQDDVVQGGGREDDENGWPAGSDTRDVPR